MWEKAKKEGGGELRGLGVRLLEPAEAVQISLRGDTQQPPASQAG